MSLARIDGLAGVRIHDAARTLGVRVVGEPGSGKSVLLALCFCFLDFVRGLPVIIWDFNGNLIDVLWKLILDQGQRTVEAMQERIRYVAVNHPDYAYGLPFYHWEQGDDAFTVAQRPLEVFLKLSPSLKEASILGEASLLQVGSAVGQLCASMSDGNQGIWQITEGLDALLHYNDSLWKGIMTQVEPAVPDAVRFFRESYGQWDRETQRNRRWAFEGRCWPYLSSRTLRAMVGQAKPSISWNEVLAKGLCVMYDFRHVHDAAVRDALSLMLMESVTEFVERRGVHARSPLTIVFDEMPVLLENPAVEPDLRRLINRYRAMKVWPVVAHQSLNQISPELRQSMWSFGNQIIGKQLNIDDCLEVVRNLIAMDPYRIKWPAQREDQMPVGMPTQDQERELAAWLQRRAGRQFLVRRYYDEETPDPSVRFIARTPDVGALERVSVDQVEAAKETNLKLFARPIDDVLREIAARLPKRVTPQQDRPQLSADRPE